MELGLSIALAVAAVAAVVGWVRRNEDRSRAQRLADELSALRKASSGQRILEADTGSSPAMARLDPGEDAPEEPRSDVRVGEARRLLARAEEALASADARPRGAGLPIDALRQEAIDLLAALERLEIVFTTLPDRGLAPDARNAPAPEVPPPPAPFDESAVATGLRGAEDLADTAGRLKDDLSGLARSTDRLREATGTSSEALVAVARGAEAIAPMAGALSAVANRVNLLALNLAVLVSPGAAGANVEEAGTELRSIFEETRRLSREVGALAQRVASAARGAAERGTELAAAIAEERARVERGVAALGALDELSMRLRDAFESVRIAARASDEERASVHAALAAAAARAEGLSGGLAAERAAAAAFAASLRETGAALTEARIAAERTVRNLLAAVESAAERRVPAADPTALEAVREAAKLLD